MNMTIHSKIVKIGNSRGIRIPKTILEQAGLTDEVEMTVDGDRLIINSPIHSRQDWFIQFMRMAQFGDDRLLDEPTSMQWDEDEWEW
jgi:antitoxin MazE